MNADKICLIGLPLLEGRGPVVDPLVHSPALARKLGVELPDPSKPRRDEVLRLTLVELSRPKIAKVMGISYNQVHHHHRCLYREHGVVGRKALAAKFSTERTVANLT